MHLLQKVKLKCVQTKKKNLSKAKLKSNFIPDSKRVNLMSSLRQIRNRIRKLFLCLERQEKNV